MFENSVHYKLRKRKKQWIVVGISVVSGLAFTFSLSITPSFAAENDSAKTSVTALVEESKAPATRAATAEDETATQTYTMGYKQVSESGKVLNEASVSGLGVATEPSDTPGVDTNHFYDKDQTAKLADFLDKLPDPIAGYTVGGIKIIQDGKQLGEIQDPDKLAGAVQELKGTADYYRMDEAPILLTNFEYDILYKPIAYQVTFDSNGGDKVGPTSYTIENGIAQLVTPTRAGYNFGGWQEGNDVITGIKTGTMGDKALKAIWNLATYQVKFDANGGKSVADQSYTINDGITSFSPSTRAGYTFAGWTDQSGTVVKSIPTGQSGDQTFKAKWTPLVYQVNFDSAGGSTVTPVSFTPDEEVKQLPTPTKANYSFEGWYDKNGKKVSAIPTGTINDVALVAHWMKAATNPAKPGNTNDSSNPMGDKNTNSSDKNNNSGDKNTNSSDKNDSQSKKNDNSSASNQKNPSATTNSSVKNGSTTAGSDKSVNLTDSGTAVKTAVDKLAGAVKNGVAKLNSEKASAAEPTMSSAQSDQNLSGTQPVESSNESSDTDTKAMSTPASNTNTATNQSTTGSSSPDAQMAQGNTTANQYPKTGEKENHLGILGVALIAIAGILGIAVTRKKSETEK